MELFNPIPLLKLGQLKTAGEFRREFMMHRDPTDPQNQRRLRKLLGEVMIFNTRTVARIDIPLQEILGGLKRAADDAVLRETAGFQESMNRRFRRDVSNLEEYYRSLGQEMRQSLDRSGLSDQVVQDRRNKIVLIPEELARKKDDLFKKYNIRISIVPCAVPLSLTPAVKVLLRVAIGNKQKAISAF